MSLMNAKKLLMAGARLREPVIMTMTAASFENVVPLGARSCEIMCVGAGFDGLNDDSAYQTAEGRRPSGSPGGRGGGAIPRTTIKVSAGMSIRGRVGQRNGEHSAVTIGTQSFTTLGLAGGEGGLPGYVSVERAQAGQPGIGDAGPGGGGGNFGSSARGGNGGSNPVTGAVGGGGAATGAGAVPGSPRTSEERNAGAAGRSPGGGGGGGTTSGQALPGAGARGEIRLKFT